MCVCVAQTHRHKVSRIILICSFSLSISLTRVLSSLIPSHVRPLFDMMNRVMCCVAFCSSVFECHPGKCFVHNAPSDLFVIFWVVIQRDGLGAASWIGSRACHVSSGWRMAKMMMLLPASLCVEPFSLCIQNLPMYIGIILCINIYAYLIYDTQSGRRACF